MNPSIARFIQDLDLNSISQERHQVLEPLIEFIVSKICKTETVRINFICTHNSRRSHLGQIWSKVMADYFEISFVDTYSAGTEATAIFPKVVEILTDTGFDVAILSTEKNPVHALKYSANEQPIIAFSKTIDHAFNPESGFAAVMTCDSANEACPFIPGAERRIPIMYDDPKAFDNTSLQTEKYQERSKQIATEMKYVFSQVANRLTD